LPICPLYLSVLQQEPDAPVCADNYPLEDFVLSAFSIYETPLACKWARIYSRSTKLLIEAAISAPELRDRRLATAIRWYAALPQLFLRDTGRKGSRKANIIEGGMNQYLAGRLSIVIQQWWRDLNKIHRRTLQPRKDVDPIRRAVNLIYDGFISRATRLVEGSGRISCDNSSIRERMLSEHPSTADATATKTSTKLVSAPDVSTPTTSGNSSLAA
jgi:hypothetical protein